MTDSKRTASANLPPLPPALQSDMEALRHVQPSPFLEMRISKALREQPAAPVRQRPAPSRWRAILGALSIAACATAAVLVVSHQGTSIYNLDPQEIAVTLPSTGHGTVELPWSLHDHERGQATVHLEAPARIAKHEMEPQPQESTCEGERCVHRWYSSVHPADKPLQVKLDSPGRYEFQVLHQSDQRQSRGTFVVIAER